jgi:hypothetical protein
LHSDTVQAVCKQCQIGNHCRIVERFRRQRQPGSAPRLPRGLSWGRDENPQARYGLAINALAAGPQSPANSAFVITDSSHSPLRPWARCQFWPKAKLRWYGGSMKMLQSHLSRNDLTFSGQEPGRYWPKPSTPAHIWPARQLLSHCRRHLARNGRRTAPARLIAVLVVADWLFDGILQHCCKYRLKIAGRA